MYCIPIGQFGKVYKATLVQARSENMTVAVKTISKYKSEQETSDFLHEMGVVMDLMHPNVVHIHGIVDQGEQEVHYNSIGVAAVCN